MALSEIKPTSERIKITQIKKSPSTQLLKPDFPGYLLWIPGFMYLQHPQLQLELLKLRQTPHESQASTFKGGWIPALLQLHNLHEASIFENKDKPSEISAEVKGNQLLQG